MGDITLGHNPLHLKFFTDTMPNRQVHLDFNWQTEAILCGLNAKDLIDEFKRKNIRTAALHQLSADDFEYLGASKILADSLACELRIIKKDKDKELCYLNRYTGERPDTGEVLQLTVDQLDTIKNFVTYCKCKLREECCDLFMDFDTSIRAAHSARPKCSSLWYIIPLSLGGLSLTTSILLYLLMKKRHLI
ncbi:uncharacterized protein LOC105278063 isoform X2 [Ooceraea biroi]|uniref:uncharacterized protein LOC105278063 isoform X2 n=1 Tax=Ooceraea biroi TaxID=2015173 RepID=UPI0005BC46AC|nr:uncharacterized protein LOC105278063 isoform X2 [Ooceraea biroi]